jgi:hypothetical protein
MSLQRLVLTFKLARARQPAPGTRDFAAAVRTTLRQALEALEERVGHGRSSDFRMKEDVLAFFHPFPVLCYTLSDAPDS